MLVCKTEIQSFTKECVIQPLSIYTRDQLKFFIQSLARTPRQGAIGPSERLTSLIL